MSNLFDASPAQLQQVRIHLLRPDPGQPRKQFDQDALAELAMSIKVIGILQPILVREESDGLYTILVGERRWRAAGLAGLTTLPCLVLSRQMDKLVKLVVQCSENAHHVDLTPLEYVDAMSEMLMAGLGASAIAQALGKRVDWVRGHELAANPAYRTLFETGRLRSVDVLAHFRALPDPARRELLDSEGPITSTRCAQLRQKHRELEERESALRQPSLPLVSTPSGEDASQGKMMGGEDPLQDKAGRDAGASVKGASGTQMDSESMPPVARSDVKLDPGPDMGGAGHSIVSLVVPLAWIHEAGGVEPIRRIALAALARS
ncbi:MAG: ParB/RepB/Spo0J family partition protein [Thiobacillaceae bacterium]